MLDEVHGWVGRKDAGEDQADAYRVTWLFSSPIRREIPPLICSHFHVIVCRLPGFPSFMNDGMGAERGAENR